MDWSLWALVKKSAVSTASGGGYDGESGVSTDLSQ